MWCTRRGTGRTSGIPRTNPGIEFPRVLRVYTSNALEALAEALASALPAPGAGHGRALFDDLWLLTPSHTVGAFVELALARRRGIASNLVPLSLREAVARLVASTDRDGTVGGVS